MDRITSCSGGGGSPVEEFEVVQQVRKIEDRQLGQMDEGGPGPGNPGVLEVQGQRDQGQLVDTGIGTADYFEEIMGDISKDLDFIPEPAISNSNFIHVKPAKDTNS